MAIFGQAELKKIDEILWSIQHESTSRSNFHERLAKVSLRASDDLHSLHNKDPFSDEYLAEIRAVHEEIIGWKGVSRLERPPKLKSEYALTWPYQCSTGDAGTAANSLIALGFLIHVADIHRHGRILEVGCGAGSLTWNLAQMGYRVDALAPDPAQCEHVVTLTKSLPMAPNVITSTLSDWIEKREKNYKYDAVIFFGSFRHLIDHQSCLQRLTRDGHIEDDAQIILAAEPLFPSSCDDLPYLWGPRLDGRSLRAMRETGQLELGFTRGYLRDLLARVGMQCKYFETQMPLPFSQTVVCRRRIHRPYYEVMLTDKSHRYEASLSDGFDLSVQGFPSFLKWSSGLSIAEEWGRWTVGSRVELIFAEQLPSSIEIVFDLHDVFGPNLGKHLTVTVGQECQTAPIEMIGARTTYSFKFREVKSKMLTLLIPHPTRPKDFPELCNEDTRQIGIAIRKISFREL